MNFNRLRDIVFFGLLGLITIAFLYIIKDFFYPLFWAAVIASIFYPLYKKLAGFLKLKNISAIITMIIIFIIIVIPIVLFGSLLIKESIDLYQTIDQNRSQITDNVEQSIAWLRQNSYTGQLLNIDEKFWVEKFSEAAKYISAFIFNSLKSLTQNSLIFLAMTVIMFYSLFFFLRDGEKLLKKMMYLSPLGDKNEQLLYTKFTSTARAAIKGTLLVGFIQGALGGILFMVTGIQGAMIWGILMIVASIIPALGSYIIWVPAGITMLIVGNTWQGILILAFGALVIGTIDNFLRPILVGKDTRMHPLIILFSTLGGLLVFGISGFIIGPIVSALFLAFWDMYAAHYKKELKND